MSGCRWCLGINKRHGHTGRCKELGKFGSVSGYFWRNHASAIPQYIMFLAHGMSEEEARQAILTKAEIQLQIAKRAQELRKVERRAKRQKQEEEFNRECAKAVRGSLNIFDAAWQARTGLPLPRISPGQGLPSDASVADVLAARVTGVGADAVAGGAPPPNPVAGAAGGAPPPNPVAGAAGGAPPPNPVAGAAGGAPPPNPVAGAADPDHQPSSCHPQFLLLLELLDPWADGCCCWP